jgi:glycosyltransferase involved in cell wall biosynthesis
MWTKHIKLAILAFIRFKQQHPQHQKFSLVIAGRVDHKSQSYLETLKQLAHRRSDIQFILNPTDTELSKLYHSCYAVLSSAFNEDWGLTLIEANAHAKPVIAINRGGPTESQIDGQTGLLVPPPPKAVAHALYHLASNPQLTQELSQNARRHSKQYDWTHYQHILHQQLTQLTKPSK